jgi:hypothetical protein
MFEIFVFGAGASYASSGAPLGKDLVWQYYDNCSAWHEVGDNGCPTPDDLNNNLQEFSDFIVLLQKLEPRYPGLSGVSRKLKKAMESGSFSSLNIGKAFYIDEIMEDLIRSGEGREVIFHIRRVASQHIAKAVLNGPNKYYKEFVKALKVRRQDEVVIISFNFDCLLTDDLDERIYFDYLIKFDGIHPNRCFYKTGQGIPLLKLHGSLDWKVDSDRIFLLPTEWHNGFGGEPYIFLPHEKSNNQLNQLWLAAAEFVGKTDKITFIGYSMPDYDREVLELFKSNVRNETQINVIDNSIDTINKYKKLFPQSQGIINNIGK